MFEYLEFLTIGFILLLKLFSAFIFTNSSISPEKTSKNIDFLKFYCYNLFRKIVIYSRVVIEIPNNVEGCTHAWNITKLDGK